MGMTNEQMQEARRLCNEATPGPWGRVGFEVRAKHDSDLLWTTDPLKIHDPNSLYQNFFADFKFIAESRAILPTALDEIERLQSWLKRIAEVNPSLLDGEDAECMRTWAIRALVGEKGEES